MNQKNTVIRFFHATRSVWHELGLSLIFRGLAFGSTFLWLFIVNKHLGLEIVGTYFYQMAIIGYLIIVACMGLPTASKKLIPNLLNRKEFAESRHLFWMMIKRILTVSLALIFLAFTLCFFLISDREGLLILLLSIPFQSTTLLNLSMLRFFNEYKSSEYFRILHVPLFTLILTLVLLNSFNEYYVLQMAFVGTVFLGFCFSFIMLLIRMPKLQLPKEVNASLLKSQMNLSSKNFLKINLLKGLSEHLPIFFLGTFSSNIGVGIFTVIKKMMQIFTFIVNSMSVYLSPEISSLFYSNQMEALKKKSKEVSIMTFVVNLPLLLGLLIFGSEMLSLFKVQYLDGTKILHVFVIAQMIVLVFGFNQQLLNMTGNESILVKLNTIFLIIKASLLFLTIYFFNLLAFSLVIVGLEIIYQFTLLKVCSNRLGINNLILPFMR